MVRCRKTDLHISTFPSAGRGNRSFSRCVQRGARRTVDRGTLQSIWAVPASRGRWLRHAAWKAQADALEELADKTAVPARTVGIVAAAMVSLGLIDQEGSRYRNGEAESNGPAPPAND